jgi:hypothetical protein
MLPTGEDVDPVDHWRAIALMGPGQALRAFRDDTAKLEQFENIGNAVRLGF